MLILLVFVGLCNDVLTYPNKHASYPVPIRPSCSFSVPGSVQTFAGWLTLVYGSPQATLPLANASGRYPSA
jgi:hypothetical protein